MRPIAGLALLLLWAGSVGPVHAEVPVRSVMLFSSGVGYFEHAGTVTGDGSTDLFFKTSQIDDLLKSLVLEDLDGGHIGSVVYPAKDPLAKTLKSFQVDLSGNPPLAELLKQLRGATVIVQASTEAFEGAILGVEPNTKTVDGKEVLQGWGLTLLAGGSIRAVDLDAVRKLTVRDPRLQGELAKALAAVAEARDQNKKTVTIHYQGAGQRRVRFGYVVETPIWKASYRLILPDSGTGKAKLQGWAILENQTDQDWSDVSLSLVSGRPISFVLPLSDPLYVSRPVVQPELYGSLRPQTYDAGAARSDVAERARAMEAGREKIRAEQERSRAEDVRRSEERQARERRSERPAALPIDPTAGVASVASAANMGDLFHYAINHVTLPRQRSAMLPIVVAEVEAEKVSLYNQAVLAQHPLTGARLKNTTSQHLSQGPVTVLAGGGYAGDATIDTVPPGQARWLSYGVDLQMQVTSTAKPQTSVIQSGKLVKGVLYLSRRRQAVQEYLIENKSEQAKVLVVEHPLRPGWTLVEPSTPIETTNAVQRFKERVEPGKMLVLKVREDQVIGESIALLDADVSKWELYSRTGEIPTEVRETLAKAASLRQALVETDRRMQTHQAEIRDIGTDQERLRANIKETGKGTAYYDRLLNTLNEQETQIQQLHAEIERLKRQAQAQQEEWERFLQAATVE